MGKGIYQLYQTGTSSYRLKTMVIWSISCIKCLLTNSVFMVVFNCTTVISNKNSPYKSMITKGNLNSSNNFFLMGQIFILELNVSKMLGQCHTRACYE